MENTCNWEDCALRKKLKLKDQTGCPNYIESGFVNKKGERLLTHDCAPIRTLLMLYEMNNRLIAVEKADEQQRNQVAGLLALGNLAVKKIEHEDDGVIEGEFSELPAIPDSRL